MSDRKVRKSNSLKGNKGNSKGPIKPKRKESYGPSKNAEVFLNKIINNSFSPITNYKQIQKFQSSTIENN